MATLAKYTTFGSDGLVVGGGQMLLPDYLDRVDVRAKMYWFITRGMGEPEAYIVLLDSQGERMVSPIESPLRSMKHHELKGIENGLEENVRNYCERNGISLERTSSSG